MVCQCVAAFAVDFWLQTHLFQCGVLWHLLLFIFNYDYTLEEGGVEKCEDSNQQVCYSAFVIIVNVAILSILQEVANQLARLAIHACARLGGYLPDDLATPDNPAVKKTLSALLTSYVARKLAENKIPEVKTDS